MLFLLKHDFFNRRFFTFTLGEHSLEILQRDYDTREIISALLLHGLQ